MEKMSATPCETCKNETAKSVKNGLCNKNIGKKMFWKTNFLFYE